MFDRIQAMRTFIRIVDTNSFTKAAESLEIPRASATTIVQNLEALLGTQLLVRTTRRLSLTAEGAAYYERCAQILADIDEMEASLRNSTDALSGRLRVEMPGVVANAIVLPALADFHARYPNLDVAVGVTLRNVDLVGEAVDCSIQFGELPDSGLAARRLGALEHVTCASPAYVGRYGMPASLDDLAQHVAVNCLAPVASRPDALDFEVDGAAAAVKMNGFVRVGDEQAYLTCGLQGYGLIQPARLTAQPYLDTGQLVEVLPQWKPLPMPVSAVFVKSRRVSPRVRAFVDWLAELFEGHSLMDSLMDSDLSHVHQLLRGLQPA
ncbi:LysR family transcriptional regulator [Paraburkholderia sp. SUR17]|uniref:LysR family transcriptional regulator n=1 Tax=Paraburkholderia sp. SUR17 TaxID=3034358 RepID=UPI002407A0E8|nr:LysR family transcriptional regulator [Paraburkholderia sp. SUR17]WEY42873.1 LysR family transcriptional regulator [Paraburkholderia sp. SUR17]